MFDTGYREAVINSHDDFALRFYEEDGTPVLAGASIVATNYTPATTAASAAIQGIGKWTLSQVTKANLSRGVALRKFSQRLLVSTTPFLTLTAPSASEVHRIVFKTVSHNWDSLQAQHQKSFGKRIAITVELTSGSTLTQILTAVYKQLKEYNKYAKDEKIIIPSIAAGTESAVTKLDLIARDEFTEWTVELLDNDGNTSSALSGYTPDSTNSVKRYEGLGTGKFIRENVRLWTDESRRPYGIASLQQPQNATDLYTELNFEVVKEDPSTGGFVSTNSAAFNVKNRVTLFVKEDATTTTNTVVVDGTGKVTAGYITALASFLLRSQTVANAASLTVTLTIGTNNTKTELDATTGEPLYIVPATAATLQSSKPVTAGATFGSLQNTLAEFIS